MKQETAARPKEKRQVRSLSAKEKSEAVLALWNHRRTAAALGKELGVPWATINLWEKKALAGMLAALDPKWKQAAGPRSLPPRVEKLMAQTFPPVPAETVAATN